MSSEPQRVRQGLFQAFGAYGIWGLLPLYFLPLVGVPAPAIVAHRIVWSVLLLLVLVTVMRRWGRLRVAFTTARTRWLLTASALLISLNWLVYVWSVEHHQVIAASLGYFLNPLVNVLLGTLLLGERLTRAQAAAVGLATLGVAVLAAGTGAAQGLAISLTLALSFGLYGLVRKLAPVEAIEGLAVETLLLAPIALGYLLGVRWMPAAGLGPLVTVMLIASGAVTAAPLMLFAAAARRLRLVTMGLIQYCAPTLQFIVGIALGERLTTAHLICFALIWAGLAIVVVSNLTQLRRSTA